MSQHAHVSYVNVLPVLGAAMVLLWLAFAGVSVRQWCAQAVLTVTGYLRPRPARSLESALRAAFAELDRELAGLLGDRDRRRWSR